MFVFTVSTSVSATPFSYAIVHIAFVHVHRGHLISGPRHLYKGLALPPGGRDSREPLTLGLLVFHFRVTSALSSPFLTLLSLHSHSAFTMTSFPLASPRLHYPQSSLCSHFLLTLSSLCLHPDFTFPARASSWVLVPCPLPCRSSLPLYLNLPASPRFPPRIITLHLAGPRLLNAPPAQQHLRPTPPSRQSNQREPYADEQAWRPPKRRRGNGLDPASVSRSGRTHSARRASSPSSPGSTPCLCGRTTSYGPSMVRVSGGGRLRPGPRHDPRDAPDGRAEPTLTPSADYQPSCAVCEVTFVELFYFYGCSTMAGLERTFRDGTPRPRATEASRAAEAEVWGHVAGLVDLVRPDREGGDDGPAWDAQVSPGNPRRPFGAAIGRARLTSGPGMVRGLAGVPGVPRETHGAPRGRGRVTALRVLRGKPGDLRAPGGDAGGPRPGEACGGHHKRPAHAGDTPSGGQGAIGVLALMGPYLHDLGVFDLRDIS